MEHNKRRGLLLVISSPSGVGKTSIVTKLLKLDPELVMSTSVTTRTPRPGEIEGQDYYFVDHPTFQNYVNNGDLLEYAKVYGNYYGTPRQFVLDKIDQGIDIVFDIDWQGTQQLAQTVLRDLVSIFILPPSLQELAQRLRNRGLDTPEVVENRLSQTANELSHWAEYDYIIINEDLDDSVKQVQTILNSERLRRIRQPQLVSFVQQLCNTTL
jgi:guanylate kinase